MTAPAHERRSATARPIVLVPLDGSEPARSALPVGRGLAEALGGVLQILHVAGQPLPPVEANRRLDCGAVDVVRTATGDPAAAILAAATADTHVVLTAHCGHPAGRAGLGHVAEAVLRGARGPVVLVPPGRGESAWHPRAVILPLDGAPGSAEAVRHARRLGDGGAHLLLLHVATPDASRPCEAGTFTAPRYADQPQHEWPAWRDEFAARSGHATGHPCPPTVRVTTGAPGPATARVAADTHADLVGVAWHGDFTEGHADTLRALLAQCACPVLVVRAR